MPATALMFDAIGDGISKGLESMPRLPPVEVFEHMVEDKAEPYQVGLLTALMAHLIIAVEINKKDQEDVRKLIGIIYDSVRQDSASAARIQEAIDYMNESRPAERH